MPVTEVMIFGIWCDADGCSAGFDLPPDNSEDTLRREAEEEGWVIDSGGRCYCGSHAQSQEQEGVQ
jgi:hypothetical protein